MSDFSTFTPESLAHHDAVVERNLRLHLAEQITGIAEGDDLLGQLLRVDTAMAEGARMALEIAAEVVLDEPTVVVFADDEEKHAPAASNRR